MENILAIDSTEYFLSRLEKQIIVTTKLMLLVLHLKQSSVHYTVK